MAITYDITTNIGKVRRYLNDTTGATFNDAEIQDLINQANVNNLATIPQNLLYFAAYLGWLEKAGTFVDAAKKQKIAIISKDTTSKPTFALVQAERYRMLSIRTTGAIEVVEHELDTHGHLVDSDIHDPAARNRLVGEIW